MDFKEIDPQDALKCASIGASALGEIRRVLAQNNIDPHYAIAALASAACGCLKSLDMDYETFKDGIKSCDPFWEDDGDFVTFNCPELDDLLDALEEAEAAKDQN